MKILDFYIIRKFLATFFTAISLIIIIVIVVDVSENIQDFLDGKAPINEIITGYYFNFIPYFVNLLSPLFTFIAVIFFTSKLSGNSEIVAMLNAGVSLYRLLVPYLIAAVIIGILSFYLSNFLIPTTSKNLMAFKEKYVSRQVRSKQSDNHMKLAHDTYAYVHYWDNVNLKGHDFWYEKFDKDGVKYKISAQTIAWDSVELKWRLSNYVKRYISGVNESVETGLVMDTVINMKPTDFVWIKNGVDIMNYKEIRAYIAEEKEKGSDNVKVYEVEKHRRIAFPFSTIILTVIGVCVSSRKTRQGMGLHLLVGLAISFSFIMLMQVSQVFAVSGGVPIQLAIWVPNILYSILCVFLLLTTPK